MTTPNALAELAEQSGTTFILALFVDLNGKPCAKLVPVEAVDELATAMRRVDDDSYEQRLDRIRQVVGEERFALGVQLIEARHDPLDIAAGLSRVAEAACTLGPAVHGSVLDATAGMR